MSQIMLPKTRRKKEFPQENFDCRTHFSQLYHHYYGPLTRYALSLLNSQEGAEEVVSDVFVKIWKNRQKLKIKRSLQSYLFTAVRHQAIDYLRRINRQRSYWDEICPNYPSNYGSPEEDAISGELESLIETTIESLPPQGQKVFRLSRDCGMEYHEIAEYLNLSVKTVETHMCRSLRRLRSVIHSHYA